MGLVIDNARHHEQRRLKGGVTQNMKHRGKGRSLGAKAEQKGDQPQVADGGIGQNRLQIILEQRHLGGKGHGQ